MQNEEIKQNVRKGYAKVVKQGSCCCKPLTHCCGTGSQAKSISKKIGYSEDDLNSVPEGANLGLGCGNPIALASLKPGEIVLDLGSGAGFDAFLSARRVGPAGKVIGVDMTPEMIEKAQQNAIKGKFTNVEFRLGEIESLPVDDNSIDVIISNCVINLVPDKAKAFSEAYRVLKPGGRLMVSDIVLIGELSVALKKSVEAYVGCLAGAVMKTEYLRIIAEAGFKDVQIQGENPFTIKMLSNDPNAQPILDRPKVSDEELDSVTEVAMSIKVSAQK
jgi:SAM-dependent methyltransferase